MAASAPLSLRVAIKSITFRLRIRKSGLANRAEAAALRAELAGLRETEN